MGAEFKEYFFVGLEAHLRNSNKFFSLGEAVRVAALASKKAIIPIRVFKLLPSRHAQLIGFVDESGEFTAMDNGYVIT